MFGLSTFISTFVMSNSMNTFINRRVTDNAQIYLKGFFYALINRI